MFKHHRRHTERERERGCGALLQPKQTKTGGKIWKQDWVEWRLASYPQMGTDARRAHPPSTHCLLQTRNQLASEKSSGEMI